MYSDGDHRRGGVVRDLLLARYMLQAAKFELEQSVPQGNPKAGPAPMRVTITSCMANPVGTSEMTARTLTDLVSQHEFTTGKCEVAYQDFDVVPLYPPDLVERLSNGLMTMADADST